VRVRLINSMKYSESLDMIYITNNGAISKRRVKVIQIEEGTFRAYCYLRKSTRTFKIDNVLALVPVIQTESMVI
jgi:predicted DNA-binding transcriptional regulator YafY